jgi:hypothetical protein
MLSLPTLDPGHREEVGGRRLEVRQPRVRGLRVGCLVGGRSSHTARVAERTPFLERLFNTDCDVLDGVRDYDHGHFRSARWHRQPIPEGKWHRRLSRCDRTAWRRSVTSKLLGENEGAQMTSRGVGTCGGRRPKAHEIERAKRGLDTLARRR